MTPDTPRADACPHCGGTKWLGSVRCQACLPEYMPNIRELQAEVKMLKNILENTRESRDTMIEDRNLLDQELKESKAEVKRLRFVLMSIAYSPQLTTDNRHSKMAFQAILDEPNK